MSPFPLPPLPPLPRALAAPFTIAFATACAAACAPLLLAAPAAADTIVLPVDEDSAPYSFVPSLPRGNHPTLYAFHGFDAPTSTVHDFETYLWFDVTQSDLPAGHVLVEATLVVTYAFDFTDFGEPSTDPGTLECRKVTGAWSESSLTWVNRPTVAAPFDTITGITGFGAQLCDATAVVLEWLGNRAPNEGFALTNATDRVIGMHSREASASAALKPTLILRTEAPEPGFAAALAAGAAALAGSRRARSRARAARLADRSRRTAP